MKLGFLVIGRATAVYLHDLVMTVGAVVLALYLRVGNDAFGLYRPVLVTSMVATFGLAASGSSAGITIVA